MDVYANPSLSPAVEGDTLLSLRALVPAGAPVVVVGAAAEGSAVLPPGWSVFSKSMNALADLELLPGSCVAFGRAARDGGDLKEILRAAASITADVIFGFAFAGGQPGLPASFEERANQAGLTVHSYDGGAGLTLVRLLRRTAPRFPPPSVVALSCAGSPNFGDRLGVQILNQIIPANATLRHIVQAPLPAPAEPIDLLLIGLGGSMYNLLLSDALLKLAEHSKCVIGIFGTQYRESLNRPKLRSLLRLLNVWYARYREDLLLFGGECPCAHLGDWLFNAFPMTEPDLADTLTIGPEILHQDHSLDRMIQRIQRYERVCSARLHPLVCALASARQVAYCEEREHDGVETSGKFRSMLMDVFGFHYPENTFFDVDRDAVRAYKQFVQGQTAALSRRLATAAGAVAL